MQYQFELDGQVEQPFGDGNAVMAPLPPEEADRLTVIMRMGDESIRLPLMTANTCVFR